MTEPVQNEGQFHTTRWTLVLAARGTAPAAKQALRDLCEAYYAPVELFLQRHRGAESARDLAQEFFARLLTGHSLDGVDRARGRFRSYLLGAVKHFLADFDSHRRSASRGGGRMPLSLEGSQSAPHGDNPAAIQIADPSGFPPDAYFDSQWARTLVARAVATLHEEALAAGNVARFEVLKHWIVTPASQNASGEAARPLDMTDGAFNVAVHRLRKRFRAVVKSLLAETVDNPADIDQELQYLIRALSTPPICAERAPTR